MKTMLSLLLMVLCAKAAFSQNYVFKGTQKYPATNSWEFRIGNGGFPSELNVCVAKTKTGGYLMLSVEKFIDDDKISGNILMILQNGKTVTLTQRAASDQVNDNAQALYVINGTSFKLLQESNINSIRFSVTSYEARRTKNYLAINKGSGLYMSEESYNTAQEITDIQEENQ